MNARHLEERREMFMGEELIYFVTVFDDRPPVDDSNPYCDGGRCYTKPETPIRPVVEKPVVEKRVPSKAEFVRLFALAGALPVCVVETRDHVATFVQRTREVFATTNHAMPRRLRRAIARLDLADPASWYSTGDIVRVGHYLLQYQQRITPPALRLAYA